MFKLGKRAISQYIRSECDRRLWLDLYPSDKASREAVKAPTKDAGRPGLRLLTEQGLRFEAEKFRELKEVFKENVKHGDAKPRPDSQDSNFTAIDLKASTGWLQPGIFLLEAEYEVTKPFISANGLDALPFDVFARVRPDIVHVVEADGSRRRKIDLDGTVRDLDPADSRVGLRIIDVKFAADPSPAHFVELAYYGMTLAGWLVQNRLQDRYVVLSDAAIWSGKHEASQLYKVAADARRMGRDPADHELSAAFEEDLVSLEPDVVVGRLKRFLRHDLTRVVGVGDWRDLPWHIAQSCSGCDYLGYGWSKTDEGEDGLPTSEAEDDKKKDWSRHCWSEAARKDSANRVFGLTKGAMGKLRSAGVADLQGLAALQATNRAFEGHQTLRANRALFPVRASKLLDRSAGAIPDRAGTSGTMPGWSDIRVFLHTDFDIGSGLTFDFAYMIDGSKPSGWNTDKGSLERAPLREGPQRPKFYSVKNNKILMELDMFRQFLTDLAHDLKDAAAAIDQGYRTHDKKGSKPSTKATVQFYFWDSLAFEHLRRLCGRHLNEIRSLKIGTDDIEPLLWLVPAEQLLQDEMFIKAGSPVTILSEAIRNLVAADIPHHYGLLPLANTYRKPRRDGQEHKKFRIDTFYFDPLTDQLPSERGIEMWTNTSPTRAMTPDDNLQRIRWTAETRLRAMASVQEKLHDDLGDTLTAQAPNVEAVLQPSKRLDAAASDLQAIYQHARATTAAQSLDVALLMAMPPHVREAKFKSVRADAVLEGKDREKALRDLGLAEHLHDDAVLALRISERSQAAKMKEGDRDISLLPESRLPDAEHKLVGIAKVVKGLDQHSAWDDRWKYVTTLRDVCKVEILKFDRPCKVIVVRTENELFRFLRRQGYLDFTLPGDRDFAILDPMHADYFTRKLKQALPKIGRPALAETSPLFRRRVARVQKFTRGSKADPNPSTPFVWQAGTLAEASTGVDGNEVLRLVRGEGPAEFGSFNPSQEDAIRHAASRRLSLIWGPPGTGKSKTAKALVFGLVCEALKSERSLRIAITGPNWTAIDNVAADFPDLFDKTKGPLWSEDRRPVISRLASKETDTKIHAKLRDFVVPSTETRKDDDPPTRKEMLLERLHGRSSIEIVAGTADQIWNLAGKEDEGVFDVILVDEASQMDVAHALVVLTTVTATSSLVVVGDHLQMPPIHPIESPEDCSHLVGSIYDFYRHYRKGEEGPPQGIEPVMLSENYRSNAAIVGFVREAGYGPDFKSVHPDLRITMAGSFETRPKDWPQELPWSDHYAGILDPGRPLVAVVHQDIYASQQNEEEALLVAALCRCLEFRLEELDEQEFGLPMSGDALFSRGIGIVTPHRAQQAAIIRHLDAFMPTRVSRGSIFSAVDTVERFQGQQRAVVIASFGLGDVDQISSEEEFLYSLNRFNVIASRARAKLVVIVSRKLVDHLPRDGDVLRQSRLLKHYVDGHLRRSEAIMLPGFSEECELRYRDVEG